MTVGFPRHLVVLAALVPLLLANKDFERLLGRPPVEEFDSAKSVGAMTECLAAANMDGRPNVVPGDGRTIVTFGNGKHVFLAFVITPGDAGTHVAMHRWWSLQGKKDKATSCR